PYGRAHISPESRIDMPLRFPGHYYDAETGLHCNGYRYYSPELGRYLQSDPMGIAGGLNLYAYPPNPLTNVDLDGLHGKQAGNKAKKGKGTDAESTKVPRVSRKTVKKSGMKMQHVKNLQRRCAKKKQLAVIRASNPKSKKWHTKPNTKSKPLDVKLKTQKTGKNAGLVTKKANVNNPKYDDWHAHAKKKGYDFDDDGVLRSKNGKGDAVYGDYDMQGVYAKQPDGSYKGTPTNDKSFQRGMNEDVTPDRKMFNHGANDDYKVDGKMGRQPDPDESYLVVDENGNAKMIDGTDNLKQEYKDRGIKWPYD
ncbi:MAG: hypothetical protein GF341_11445, partial [candidate division Zixibacteria bacterium]|nr:hypothetical protein [candidate division Zixibacteria bacterium]